jgi:CubicO group peptidase (beta-lactamase class C family)
MHILALGVVLWLAPVFPAQVAAPPAASKEDVASRVDAIAAAHLAEPGAVGLSIAVGRGDAMLLEKGYGKAEAEFGALANASTSFRIGSVTKQFTAALVMSYVERGEIDLDADLSLYVPSFPLQGHEVTIRQLLSHTSGIVSYTDLESEWTSKWPLELTHEELLALVKDKPFVFEPGTKWAYNNTGYYLLGMVLEKVAGKPYAAIVREEISEKLALSRTRYDSNSELIENRAQGYAFEGGKLANDQILGMNQPGAAGALLSTAGELVRWQIALRGGRVVSPESYALMTTPNVLPDGTPTHYGFGLMIDDREGSARIQHGGGIFGFNSMLAFYPDSGLHVAVISNGESVSSKVIADEIAFAVGAAMKRAVKDETVPAEKLASLAGRYKLAGIELEARVFEKGGKLFLQATGQPEFRLLWQGDDSFRAEFDTSVRLVFKADASAFTLHQGGGIITASRMK